MANDKLIKAYISPAIYSEIENIIRSSEIQTMAEFLRISVQLLINNKENILK